MQTGEAAYREQTVYLTDIYNSDENCVWRMMWEAETVLVRKGRRVDLKKRGKSKAVKSWIMRTRSPELSGYQGAKMKWSDVGQLVLAAKEAC